MTDEYLFWLDIVTGIKIDIYTSTGEPGARHVLTSTTDDAVVEGKEIVLAV